MTKRPSSKSLVANFAITSVSSGPDRVALSQLHPQPSARVGAGVIGATQRTLSDIREERDRLQALVASGHGLDLDPGLIDPSPFPDRLPDDTDEDFEEFKRQLAREGQKISIQVRSHPAAPGRYQIIYGHRRWRACRELGATVRAFVVELTDAELAVAQGIENAARQDLSWIERSLFVWRMDQAQVKTRDIRAALSIDDPELARLRQVSRAVPIDLVEAIGRAPRIGRPRWVDFAARLAEDPSLVDRIRKTLSADKVSVLPSDERFGRALAATKAHSADLRESLDLKDPNGKVIGRASFEAGQVRVSVKKAQADAFSRYLRGELPSLVERFFAAESRIE